MSTTGESTTNFVSKRIRIEYRRIPCRARSLSRRHNCDTAYFDIPWNTPHGLQIQCSQEECIQSGRRFRYCQVCKLPVAKRNFVRRHGHGMVQSAKELRETIDRCHPINQGQEGVSSQTAINVTTTYSCHPAVSSYFNDAQDNFHDLNGEPRNVKMRKTLATSTQNFSNEDYLRTVKFGIEVAGHSTSKDSRYALMPKRSKQNYEPVPDPLNACNLTSSIIDDELREPNLMDMLCMDNFFNLPYVSSESVRIAESKEREAQQYSADATISIDYTRVFD